MNSSRILLRGKKAALKEEQPHRNESSVPAVAWAIAIALASIAWATAVYFMERERQRAQVEIARLKFSQEKVKDL